MPTGPLVGETANVRPVSGDFAGLDDAKLSTMHDEDADIDGDPSGDIHSHAGHGHGNIKFDEIGEPEHRHETVDGFIIFEALNTDHAFIERKVRTDYRFTKGADDGTADENEFSVELFWALTDRCAVIVEGPFISRDQLDEPNTAGAGDLEAGLRFVAFNGKYSILSFGLNVEAPIGDEQRGLGEGHATLEPLALLWWDLGCGNTFQSDVRISSPLSVRDPQDELIYNFALLHTITESRCWPVFRSFTPLFEVNSHTAVNGPDYGNTVVNLTPGFRWAVTDENHAGFGVSFLITSDRDFDAQYIFSFVHHF